MAGESDTSNVSPLFSERDKSVLIEDTPRSLKKVRDKIYNKIPDIQQHKNNNFYEFVKSATSDICSDDIIASRVIRSFLRISAVTHGTEPSDDERNIRNWLAHLLAKGTSAQTAKRYLGKLHSIYSSYSTASVDTENFFFALRKEIEDPELYILPDTHKALEALPLIAAKATESGGESAKILMYSIYTGVTNLSDLLDLKFSNARTDIPQIKEILSTIPTARRSYVFDSDRSDRRPKQLRQLAGKLRIFLSRYGIQLPTGFTEDTLRILWISSALKCGIQPEQITAVIDKIPARMKWLNLVESITLTDNKRTEIQQRVADFINPATPAWFAMFMRNRTKPEDIKNRISEAAPRMLEEVTLFYPTRQIKVGAGKKILTKKEAVIPHILFFQTRPDKVSKLFGIIGDMAWCFKVTKRPGSPYARISGHEMEQFRAVLGSTDRPIKINYEKRSELIPDRRVLITDGIFKGQEGVIYKRKGYRTDRNETCDEDVLLFALRLNDDNCVTWELTLPETSLQPL